jgi:hypothetical protein
MTTGHIWDRNTGRQLAWIQNDRDVYSVETGKKFATVRDRELFSLQDEPLNLHLQDLHGQGVGQVGKEGESDVLRRFKKLANED